MVSRFVYTSLPPYHQVVDKQYQKEQEERCPGLYSLSLVITAFLLWIGGLTRIATSPPQNMG